MSPSEHPGDSNPCGSPASRAPPEPEVDYRDTGLKITMVLLLTCGVGATVYLLGLWASLGVAGAFSAVALLLYLRLRRTRLPRASLHPGEVPCPRCRSLQTDEVEEAQPDGAIVRTSVCFACDHRWAPRG